MNIIHAFVRNAHFFFFFFLQMMVLSVMNLHSVFKNSIFKVIYTYVARILFQQTF